MVPNRYNDIDIVFVCRRLGEAESHGVPIPNILDYSVTNENPLDVEYIVMDKARGEELGNRWFSLPDLERAKLI
jgi:hypothetical protein